jgi:hypothetical protein
MNYNPSLGQPALSSSSFPALRGLFPVYIGPDVSGAFAMSLYGLAVIRPDGCAVVHRDEGLLDVTLFLLPGLNLGPGVNSGVLRIPVAEVKRGELIVTSDCPFSLLYVLEQNEARVRGLDPFTGNIVQYTAPLNLFFNYFVRVQSLFGSLFAEMGELEKLKDEAVEDPDRDDHPLRFLLPLLLLGCQGQNSSISLVTLLVFLKALSKGRLNDE